MTDAAMRSVIVPALPPSPIVPAVVLISASRDGVGQERICMCADQPVKLTGLPFSSFQVRVRLKSVFVTIVKS